MNVYQHKVTEIFYLSIGKAYIAGFLKGEVKLNEKTIWLLYENNLLRGEICIDGFAMVNTGNPEIIVLTSPDTEKIKSWNLRPAESAILLVLKSVETGSAAR